MSTRKIRRPLRTKRVHPADCDRCPIPYRAQPRQDRPGYFEGDMFCVVCPDADRIPVECEAVCVPSQGSRSGLNSQRYHCPKERRDRCPCATPATVERKRAYTKWCLARGRELAKHTRDRKREDHWRNR